MITPFQLLTFLVYSIAIILAIYFSSRIADGGLSTFFQIMEVGGMLAWIVFGGRWWWFPLFLGLGFGGVFYFGFKVYPYEVGLVLGLASVLPMMAIQRESLLRRHFGLPRVFWALLLYLILHCLASCVLFGRGGLSGGGSVFRAYFGAIWPLVFLAVLYRAGSSRRLHWCLYALELGGVLRLVMGFVALFWPSFLYLPGVNLILPGSIDQGISDLRTAGLNLFIIATAFLFTRHGGLLLRVAQGFLLAVAFAALLFGGGRTGFVMSLFGVVVAVAYGRKWLLGGLLFLLGAALVVAVNLFPVLLEGLPSTVERATSVLIVKSGATAMQRDLASSEGTNEWHQQLRGTAFRLWTESPRSFFVGTGIKAYDFDQNRIAAGEHMYDLMMESAVAVGAYECGFWRVLTPLGAVGLACYLSLFFIFGRRILLLSRNDRTSRFGAVFSFLGIVLPLQWLVFSFLNGDFPSLQIAVAGMAIFYLEDRVREQEDEAAAEPAPEDGARLA